MGIRCICGHTASRRAIRARVGSRESQHARCPRVGAIGVDHNAKTYEQARRHGLVVEAMLVILEGDETRISCMGSHGALSSLEMSSWE